MCGPLCLNIGNPPFFLCGSIFLNFLVQPFALSAHLFLGICLESIAASIPLGPLCRILRMLGFCLSYMVPFDYTYLLCSATSL
jgi:hypothetical protein